jgi:hypothetical protein
MSKLDPRKAIFSLSRAISAGPAAKISAPRGCTRRLFRLPGHSCAGSLPASLSLYYWCHLTAGISIFFPADKLPSLTYAGCLFFPAVKLPSIVDLCRLLFASKFGPWCSECTFLELIFDVYSSILSITT